MSKGNGKKKSDVDVKRASKMLKAIADPDRLRLIMELKAGRKNVTTLADAIGSKIVNVSHHLGVLKDGDVVTDEKEGRYVYYSLNPEVSASHGGEISFSLPGCRLVIAG